MRFATPGDAILNDLPCSPHPTIAGICDIRRQAHGRTRGLSSPLRLLLYGPNDTSWAIVPHFTLFFALRASQTRQGGVTALGNSVSYSLRAVPCLDPFGRLWERKI